MVVASKGYSDDTMVLANSTSAVETLHRETMRFCRHYGLQMNAKTELRGVKGKKHMEGRLSMDPDEERMWKPEPKWVGVEEIEARDYCDKPQGLIVAKPGKPVKYLGVWVSMDGSWTKQVNELKKLVGWHAAVANSNSLTVAQTVHLFNAHLNAKLAYKLIPR